ncbi:MAG: hypothetical protein O7D91_01660 [Planctomycetota bacterium]|nr:hypothetical protein [Planctomycetota bacterium]
MKQNTTSKLKFKKLRRALGDLLLYQAVGLLESLWQFTAADAPRGDIGKFTNEDIATAVEWQGDPDELIEALVETGWLDKSDEFRLVVHHWHEHCPDYLRKRVQRRGESFVTESNRRLKPTNSPPSGTGGHRQTSAASGCLPSQAEPEPSQVKPSRDKPARRTPLHRDLVPSESSLPCVAVSGVQKKPCSDSGSSAEAARQIEDLRVSNAKVDIVELLRISPPEKHPEGSKARKQASSDFVTISKAVDHCRGDPAAIETLERLAAEVAEGKLIKKPVAAWIKRLKDANLFYK